MPGGRTSRLSRVFHRVLITEKLCPLDVAPSHLLCHQLWRLGAQHINLGGRNIPTIAGTYAKILKAPSKKIKLTNIYGL